MVADECYILDLRENEERRADAEHVIETGIILAVFAGNCTLILFCSCQCLIDPLAAKRSATMRRIHCALEQIIKQNYTAFVKSSDQRQFVLALVKTYGGLWKWNDHAFVPLPEGVVQRRMTTRFRDTVRRRQSKENKVAPIPQSFVIRNDSGIVSKSTNMPAAAAQFAAAPDLAAGGVKSFDELVKECCNDDPDHDHNNDQHNNTTMDSTYSFDDFDILSDVSSITADFGGGDLRDPQTVIRQAELNCLRVVCGNLRERIRLLELQVQRAPPWMLAGMMPLGMPLAEMVFCRNDVWPMTSTAIMEKDHDEEEEQETSTVGTHHFTLNDK